MVRWANQQNARCARVSLMFLHKMKMTKASCAYGQTPRFHCEYNPEMLSLYHFASALIKWYKTRHDVYATARTFSSSVLTFLLTHSYRQTKMACCVTATFEYNEIVTIYYILCKCCVCEREFRLRGGLSSHLTSTNVPMPATHLISRQCDFHFSQFFGFFRRRSPSSSSSSSSMPLRIYHIVPWHNSWWMRLRYGFLLYILNCIHKKLA